MLRMRLTSRLLSMCAVAALSGGCFSSYDCEPEPDISVQLEKVSEDVRSLPVLSSGKTHLLGIDVPDHHGDARVRLKMTNATSVELRSIAFEQSVDGTVKDIRLVSQQLNDKDVKDGDPGLQDRTLEFQWRIRALADYVLTAATAHKSRVTVNWRYFGCRAQEGVATLEVEGTVKAAFAAENLQLVSAEAFAPSAVNGAKAKVTVKSAVGDGLINLSNAKLQVTYFGEGLTPSIGFALLGADHLALQSGGTARASISATEHLEVYSSRNPGSNGAAYDFNGTAANVSTGGGQKALVTLSLSSSKSTQATTTQVDTLNALVDAQ